MIKSITVPCLVLSIAFASGVGCSREPGSVAHPSEVSAPSVASRSETAPEDHSNDQLAGASSPEQLASRADLPLYPGATAPDGMSNVRKSGSQTRYEILLSTPDPVDKIYAFYRAKLKNPEAVGGGKNLMGMTPKGNYASVTAVRGEDKTDVTIVVNAEVPASTADRTAGG